MRRSRRLEPNTNTTHTNKPAARVKMAAPPLVVGYAFMKKKVDTMREVIEENGMNGMVWKRIDLEMLDAGRSLEEQGPFDVVVHKLSDDVRVCAQSGNGAFESVAVGDRDGESVSARRFRALREYCSAHPSVPLVDPPAAVANVVSRIATCKLLAELHGTPIDCDPEGGHRQPRLVAPRYVVAADGVERDPATRAAIRAALLRTMCPPAPNEEHWGSALICKPVVACGPGVSHQLTVILDPEAFFGGGNQDSSQYSGAGKGPNDAEALAWLAEPTVVQEYVNHGGRLFKAYVVGIDEVRVFERKSLPDLPQPGQVRRYLSSEGVGRAGVVAFDSQKPYPTLEDLITRAIGCTEESPPVGGERGSEAPCLPIPVPPAPAAAAAGTAITGSSVAARPLDGSGLLSAVKDVARKIHGVFGLTLFGFDCVIPDGTADLMVLDVNYFPSYKEVRAEFSQLLLSHFVQLIDMRTPGNTPGKGTNGVVIPC